MSNKYARWYSNIVEKARVRNTTGYTYLEKHHILPKSLGGANTKSNLVLLTAKEHFVCHLLLARFTEGQDKVKMLRAIWSMARAHEKMKRPLTSRQFETARRACAQASSMHRHTEETKKKIACAHLGRKRSEEHCNSIGLASKGRKWSDEAKSRVNKTGENNSRAREWLVTAPNGNVVRLFGNFKRWCRENDLPSGSPVLRVDGIKMTSGRWTGWSVKRI